MCFVHLTGQSPNHLPSWMKSLRGKVSLGVIIRSALIKTEDSADCFVNAIVIKCQTRNIISYFLINDSHVFMHVYAARTPL